METAYEILRDAAIGRQKIREAEERLRPFLASLSTLYAEQITQWQLDAMSGGTAFLRTSLNEAGEVEMVRVDPYPPEQTEEAGRSAALPLEEQPPQPVLPPTGLQDHT